MKFNPQLKEALSRYEREKIHSQRIYPADEATSERERIEGRISDANKKGSKKEIVYEKIMAAQSRATVAAIREADEKPQPPTIRDRPSEKVVGGDILWKPIDRAAAMLLAKAPWWAQPPIVTQTPKLEQKPRKQKKATHDMKGIIQSDRGIIAEQEPIPRNGKYTAQSGLTITMVNGEPMFQMADMQALICEQIEKLPRETRPTVQQAEDARKIIAELLHGIGGEMQQFQANTKMYLEDIRQTRFAVVRECAEMTKELKEVRQFFLGSDYKEQVTRLREFVDLCERLQELKRSGFLDSVADTMIRLAIPQ